MKESDYLNSALEYISDINNWHQGSYFADKDGNKCDYFNATKYCALGALAVTEAPLGIRGNLFIALHQAANLLFNRICINEVNDDTKVTK